MERPDAGIKRERIIAICGTAAFLILVGLVSYYVGGPLLRFVSEPEKFRAWVDANGLWGRIAFLGMMALQVFIAFIPGEPLEIGAGYAFGALEGTILCLLGAVIGSALVFAFVHRFGVKAVRLFFPQKKIDELRFLQDSKRLNLLVFIIFFIPGTPKDILAYCVSLTNMKLSTWLIITGVARIPSVITSTIGGDALGMGEHGFAVIVLFITIAISIGGLILYRRICGAQGGKK